MPKTRRGHDTRARIVSAAAELMYQQGVRATAVADVLALAGVGKGQLYHYFATKDDLTAAVLDHQLDVVLGELGSYRLDTWAGMRAWFAALLDGQESRAHRGCPMGSLSSEMIATSPELGVRVGQAFARFEDALTEPLERMRRRGLLSSSSRPRVLAASTLAAVQGGYVLSAAARDADPMRRALAMAYRHLRAHRRNAGGRH